MITLKLLRLRMAQHHLIDLFIFFFAVYFRLTNDESSEARPIFMAGEDEGKKKEAVDSFLKNAIEPLFKRLDKMLEDNGSDYLIGNQVIVTLLFIVCISMFCTWVPY